MAIHREAAVASLLTALVIVAWPPPYVAGLPVIRALVYLERTDFAGGAAGLFGSFHYGGIPVNYVYAAPTGEHAAMTATFRLREVPSDPLYLYMRARDDDAPESCRIVVQLNGVDIHRGPSGYPSDRWETRVVRISAGALHVGENTLVIRNLEERGVAGMPPWFMVWRAAIAPAGYALARDMMRDFRVELPSERRPFPEPLSAGTKPGFPLRGIKGWLWRPEQYLAEIPSLVRCRMNFLMNCYGSMCDIEHFAWGDSRVNRWWEALPGEKKRAYERVVEACTKAGITFCFSMNPNICTRRAIRYDSREDLDLLWQHYGWMQRLGVRWFSVAMDDISEGIDASGQARLVNTLLARLRARDPGAQMIFCPTYYWGDGMAPEAKAYLEILARELDPQVYLFWTGDGVVGPITRKAAESFRNVSGHRLFLWDNYPVNDAQPTMHLGPVVDRDPDLCEVIHGYLSNPMHSQNESNRIPLFTCADYAYNPRAYDPLRSIGQAILWQTRNRRAQEVLRDLVEEYSGNLLWSSTSTAFNPVRERFQQLMGMRHGRPAAQAYLARLEDLLRRMSRAFPRGYQAEKATLRDDIRLLKKMLEDE